MAAESDDDWLSGEDAAIAVGVTRWALRRAADLGQLPYRPNPKRTGGSRRPDRQYRRGDVKAWARGDRPPPVDVQQLRDDVDDLRGRVDRLERGDGDHGGDA